MKLHSLPALFLLASVLGACSALGSNSSSSKGLFTRDPASEHQLALELPCRGSVAFAPDGKRLATSNGWSLEIRALPSGKRLAKVALRGDASEPTGVHIAWSRDGRWIAASARGERAIALVDADADAEPRWIELAHGQVSALAFAPDSGSVAAGTDAGWIEVIDALGGAERNAFELVPGARSAPVAWIGFAADGTRILARAEHGTLRVCDARGGALLSERTDLVPLAISSDGGRLVSAVVDHAGVQVLGLSDPAAPELLRAFQDPTGDGGAALAAIDVTRDRLAVAYARSFTLARWLDVDFAALGDGHALGSVRAGSPSSIALDPSGRWLALAGAHEAWIYTLDGWLEPAP